MNFFEQPPSKQWAVLKFRGEKFAEVWFKPEGEPFALTFRIPQRSFRIATLTIETLSKVVSLTPELVESWSHGDVTHTCAELKTPLPAPADDVPHLEVFVRVKSPAPVVDSSPSVAAVEETNEAEIRWQDLEARWKVILGLEVTMDSQRMLAESLQGELENSLTKSLTVEEKTHALRADVAQWEKSKSRVRFALPKLKEFVHRAVWALGSPERKKLEQLYKENIQPHIPFPELDRTLDQLENLQKDRQVLSAQGITVSQEARAIATEVQNSLRTLQSNAAASKQKKKAGSGGGKFFKSLRKMSGSD